MEGYKSFKEAVESVSSAADSWQDLSSGEWFGIDELRKMGDAYDEVIEPDGWNYFVTFEGSGEICLASTCTREIEFLFVPAGSRYMEVIAAQDKRIEKLREALVPVAYQMVLDKLDELDNDPEKYVAVFERDSVMTAEDLADRAERFLKPGFSRITGDGIRDADASNVLRMLKTPGLVMKTAASRDKLRNSPDPLIETDARTVLERMDFCVMEK